MSKQDFPSHNETILIYDRRSPGADTSRDVKWILSLKILVSNAVGVHFNTSGPYKLNNVEQQIKIIWLGKAGNCIVNATQMCFSNHILKFALCETPAPKWCCILKASYNNNSLGMSNSHSEKPRRKQAHCWIFPVWEITAAAGPAAFLCSGPCTPPATITNVSPSTAKTKLSACPAKCKSSFPYFLWKEQQPRENTRMPESHPLDGDTLTKIKYHFWLKYLTHIQIFRYTHCL